MQSAEPDTQELQDYIKSLENGEAPVINRAMRRQKPQKPRNVTIDYIDVPSNKLTKSTHKIKKLRSKNALSKQQRKRKIANARKANKESYSQVA